MLRVHLNRFDLIVYCCCGNNAMHKTVENNKTYMSYCQICVNFTLTPQWNKNSEKASSDLEIVCHNMTHGCITSHQNVNYGIW